MGCCCWICEIFMEIQLSYQLHLARKCVCVTFWETEEILSDRDFFKVLFEI